MGAGQSRMLEQANHLLERLGGPSSLSYTDPYWQGLFNAISPYTLLSLPPQQVHACLQPHCQQLLVHNPLTHNFQVLVLHTVALLADAIDPVSPRNRKHAANAVHLVWAVVQSAGATGNGGSLVSSLLQMNPNLPVPQHLAVEAGSHQQLLRLLVRRCLLCITHLDPRGAGAYCVLLEVLQLLLVLLASTQLQSSTVASPSSSVQLAAAPSHSTHPPSSHAGLTTGRGPPGTHPGLEALCSFPHIAPQVVSSLLQLYISRPGPPPEAAHLAVATHQQAASQAGLLSSAASLASSLLWLPVTTVTAMVGAVAGSEKTTANKDQQQLDIPALTEGMALNASPVADLAVLLLLVLLHVPDQPLNAYKWCLHELTDTGSRAGSPAGGTSVSVHQGQARQHPSTDGAQTGGSSAASSAAPSRAGSSRLNASASTVPPQHATVSYQQMYHSLSRALLAPSILLPHHPAAADAAVDSLDGPTSSAVAADSLQSTCPAVHAAVSAGAGLISSGAEEAVLLMYALIMGCPEFKVFVLSSPDLSQLLVPLLRSLYHVVPQQQPRLLFMLQILLLVFSQDVQWCQRIHTLQLHHGLAWCKESGMTKGASLGSLTVVILLRTISTTWSLQTSALVAPANALAALANMAPHCANLHARAAQRLLVLLHGLTKRYARMGGLETGPMALSASLSGSTATDHLHASKVAQMSVVEDYLRILLEIIQLCLTGPASHSSRGGSGVLEGAAGLMRTGSASSRQAIDGSVHQHGQLASNLELVYALLQQQEVLGLLHTHPRLGDLANNLQVVVNFFNQRLDQPLDNSTALSGKDMLPVTQPSSSPVQPSSIWSSVDQVLRVLSALLPAWRPEHLKPFPQLSFVYEEDQDSDTFFVPYAWELVLARCGSVCWQLPAASLQSSYDDVPA